MTESSRFDRIAELFERVRAVPTEERAALLHDASEGDTDLIDEVNRLLRHHDDESSVLDDPVFNSAAVSSLGRIEDTIPDHVGRYRILRHLGAGGMGVVYLARQDSPKRDVAIKVIRAGLMSRELRKRFDLEVTVLARLQHPAIAQIYEAGMYDDGSGARPFFAMEYVDGLPLPDFVRAAEMSVRGRLELIIRICEAVHHAHQRGVIHRDLKPGNILVDAAGQPKILDFGVARATDSDLQVTTLRTDVGQLIGTLPYMSPEQVLGRAHDIDTRSDVYGLGVILYELLADRLPYDLADRTLVTAAKVISEEEPPPLATIDRSYRGDLDTIVLKALEKEPDRRYQSASDLAADIRRHLNDEPIIARRATTMYQLHKFARRNKGLVGGIAATFVVLVAGVIVAAVLAIKADHARGEATRRADELEQVTAFQAAQLSELDPHVMGAQLRGDVLEHVASAMAAAEPDPSGSDTRRDDFERMVSRVNFTDIALASLQTNIFDRTLHAIDTQFADQPLVRAQMLQSLASTLHELGLLEAAMTPQEEALAIRQDMLGAEAPDTLESINAMGLLHKVQGRFDDAEPYYRQALATRRSVLGDEHEDTIISWINLGLLLKDRDALPDAERCFEEALATGSRALGEDHPRTLTARNNLGLVLEVQGRLAEARAHYDVVLEGRRRVLGPDHPRTLTTVNNMGIVLARQGHLDEAEPYFIETLGTRRRILGNMHPDTLISVSNMGGLLRRQGRLEDAEPLYREALEARRRLFGSDHIRTLVSLNNLAGLYVARGQLDTAESLHREALAGRRRVLGSEHSHTLHSVRNLGTALARNGKYAESEALLLEAFDAYRRTRGPTSSEASDLAGRLAELYERWHEAEQDAGHDLQAAEWGAKAGG